MLPPYVLWYDVPPWWKCLSLRIFCSFNLPLVNTYTLVKAIRIRFLVQSHFQSLHLFLPGKVSEGIEKDTQNACNYVNVTANISIFSNFSHKMSSCTQLLQRWKNTSRRRFHITESWRGLLAFSSFRLVCSPWKNITRWVLLKEFW